MESFLGSPGSTEKGISELRATPSTTSSCTIGGQYAFIISIDQIVQANPINPITSHHYRNQCPIFLRFYSLFLRLCHLGLVSVGNKKQQTAILQVINFTMGNELTGQQKNGEIINNVLHGLVNPEAPPQQNPNPSPNNYGRIRNSRFVRGDQLQGQDFKSRLRQDGGDKSASPIHGFYNPNMISVVGPGTYSNNPITQPGSSSPVPRQPQRKDVSRPFNFFQQLFGPQKSQTQHKPRSISASHLSGSIANRKITMLESSLNISEKKVQSLSRTVESLQQNTKSLESKLSQSQQNGQKLYQKSQYHESQVTGLQQEINKLANILAQKDSQLGQKDSVLLNKDKYIAELQIQTRTQRGQINLQESRLHEYAVREQRKDKQIREISLAKFQLNAIKIRLENNIKILEDQSGEKDKKITEVEHLVERKSKQIEGMKHEIADLNRTIEQLRLQMRATMARNEEEKNVLGSQIKAHLASIDQEQTRILELRDKIDKYHEKQIQSQETINSLEDKLAESKGFIERMQLEQAQNNNQLQVAQREIQKLKRECAQARLQSQKNQEIGEKILNDYNTARKVGQKQIQFLENKLEELSRQKQRLVEQIQTTKSVAAQRNKVFERSIIYELKQENDRLWSKLIDKSNKSADEEKEDPDFWKHKPDRLNPALRDQRKNSDFEVGKNQLQLRFNQFIRNLNGNPDNEVRQRESGLITRDVSSQSLAKLQENMEFYKLRCNELETMVQTHIALNKNLKEQIEKYTNYELAFQVYRGQLDETKNANKLLQTENTKFKQIINAAQPKQKTMENKVREVESQNKKYFEELQKMRKELEMQRVQNQRLQEENSRLNKEIHVYKKWQALYDELKGRYDLLMASSKQDYKGMYEQLQKQLGRLRSLYELKEADFEKLKKAQMGQQ